MGMNKYHNDTDKYPTIRLPIVESKRKKMTKREIASLLVLLPALFFLVWLLIILFGLILFSLYAGWIGV